MNRFINNSELQIINQSEGNDNRIVPLALEFNVKIGSDLSDNILHLSNFKGFKDSILNRVLIEAEDTKWNREHLDKLKQTIKDSQLKITIKIELEKYEL